MSSFSVGYMNVVFVDFFWDSFVASVRGVFVYMYKEGVCEDCDQEVYPNQSILVDYDFLGVGQGVITIVYGSVRRSFLFLVFLVYYFR